MPISLLFGCCQVETCVADLPAARSYMCALLGAVPVEQELARQIAALNADWQACDKAADAVVTGVGSLEPQAVALCRERIGFDVVLEAPEPGISAASLRP